MSKAALGRSIGLTFAAGALALACHGDGTDPTRALSIRAVLGADVTDTIEAQPLQALVVEVRGHDGELAHGAVVRFQSEPPADPARQGEAAIYVCALGALTCAQSGTLATAPLFTTDTTDARGRAKIAVRFGRVAGRALVRVSVPELGITDTLGFTVLPGALKILHPGRDTALFVGETAALFRIVDRYNNATVDPPAVSTGGGGLFAPNATSASITATAVGTQYVTVRMGALADSISVRVVPVGRLVVWAITQRALLLVDLTGRTLRTIIASGVDGGLGVSPRFDETRQRVTLHVGPDGGGGASTVIVVDTAGAPRRDIGPASGFSSVLAERQRADGTLFVVGRRTSELATAPYSLWRVATDNVITSVATIPGLVATYNGVDISHGATRVAYIVPPLNELHVFNVATGSSTIIEASATSPRWSASDDRIAYLAEHGVIAYINPEGTGRRLFGTTLYNPGIAWSPDGAYLLGRNVNGALHLVRASDGLIVIIHRAGTDSDDFWQPDWR